MVYKLFKLGGILPIPTRVTLMHRGGRDGGYGSSCEERGDVCVEFVKARGTHKSFFNLVKSTRNQIVFTICRLIWIQTDTVRLDPNHSENG